MVELDDEVRWILGRPNFTCGSTAQVLRILGHEIKTKAEDEQAAVMHWMLCLYEKHGGNWREEAAIIIEDAKKLLVSK